MENENAKARWKILENTGSGLFRWTGEKKSIPKASLMVRSPEFFCRNTYRTIYSIDLYILGGIEQEITEAKGIHRRGPPVFRFASESLALFVPPFSP
jgi:hypothetical protein